MIFHYAFPGNWAPISTTRGWKPRLGFQPSPLWAAHGGNRASDLLLTSLGPYQLRQIRVARPPIYKSIRYIAIASCPSPATPNPKSKIQTGRILSLGFGVWVFWVLDLGFWILDFGFLDCRSIRSFCGSPKRGCLDFGFWILDLGFWILDLGFWILDFGFWILGQGLDFA